MPLTPLNRRTFLKAAGVSIGLPLLDAMLPIGLGAEQKTAAMRAKRMVLMSRPLGLYAPYFFPEKPGKDYEPSRYLKPLAEHRGDFTVFSGMSHRGYPGGHGTDVALFTGVSPEGMRAGEIRNTVSLDQEVASRLGGDTRYPYLSLGSGGAGILSWNRKGVRLPSEARATYLFKQLFIDGTPAEIAREIERIKTGASILDGVREEARALSHSLGPADRERLDLLLTNIREAEQRLQQDQAWVLRPKPKVGMTPPKDDYWDDIRMLDRERQWFDLAQLALQTDSTRVIALMLWSHGRVDVNGMTIGHHDSSHHGQDESKIKQLAIIEDAEMKRFADFLGKMKQATEAGQSLLDQTVVFYASNLGNASAHTCDNLPILLAGGGFKHGGHLAYDRKENIPLSNLYVRMLQQMGIEMDRFGSSTGMVSDV